MGKRFAVFLAATILASLLVWPLIGLSATVTASKVVNGAATVGSGTVTGDALDTTADDGTYYSIDEGNSSQLDVQFNAWQPFTEAGKNTISKMDIILNGKVNGVDDTYYVYLWDYTRNNWTTDPVGDFGNLATSDITTTVSIVSNISNYLDSNGNFRVQIKCSKAVGLNESLKYTVLYIDKLSVDFTYDNGVSDTTGPQVVSTSPIDGSMNQDTATLIHATFDEGLQADTVNSSNFLVSDGVNSVIGSINYDSTNKEAVFTPSTTLAYNKTYTVTLTTGIKDLAGNSLASNYRWSFTTAPEGADITAPEVVSVNPPNGTMNVSPSTSVEAVFSEGLDLSTVTQTTVYLEQGTNNVSATLNYDQASKTIVLVPGSSLDYSATYTVTITTGVKDLAGNPISADYNWSFTTAAQPSSAPSVPDKVFASGISSTEVAINWVPVDQAEGYKVYRSTSLNGAYNYVGSAVGQLEAYFVDGNLAASTSYYYRVSAFNSIGESQQSGALSFSYTDENGQTVTVQLNRGTTYAPQSPRGVTLSPGPNQVILNWNANPEPNIQGYNVYRAELSGTSKGNGLIKLNSTLITGNSFTDLTVANYYDYYYRIGAVDDSNTEGYLSAERFIRIEDTPPGYVPHKDFSSDSAACATCHTTHSALGPELINTSTEPELCFGCHDGTGSQNIVYQEYTYSHYISRHPVAAGNYSGDMSCSNCHNAHLDYQATDEQGQKVYPKIMQETYQGITYNKGNQLCYSCHGVNSTLKGGDHETAFEASVHNVTMPNPPSGTENKCSNCHEPHATPNENLKRYSEENACFVCHYPDNIAPGAPDIYARMTASPSADTHHDVFTEDQQKNGSKIECQNCHNPHGLTATYKNTDPDNPAPGVLWTGIADPTESQPKTGTINEFCLKCHDGTYTSNGVVTPYAPHVVEGNRVLPNIESRYYGNDKHGIINGQPKNFDSSMGYSNSTDAPNYVLACTVCHEPHGTENGYNLRTEIKSLDGTKEKRGLLAFTWKYRDGGVIYTAQDSRFFCNGCHGRKHMGNNKSFPTDCYAGGAGCHSHGYKF